MELDQKDVYNFSFLGKEEPDKIYKFEDGLCKRAGPIEPADIFFRLPRILSTH